MSSLTSIASLWIYHLESEKKYGYPILMAEFAKNPREARILAQNVGKALLHLEKSEGEESLLAVFAASISGNPHYFDRGCTASQLLTHAVCFWKESAFPKSAYEWRSFMQSVGIVSDNIASMVHAFGVHLETEDGFHPAYEAFNRRKEPYVLTAENMKSVRGVSANNNKVYVVENEMVFLYLAKNSKETDVTLLCTSGQLRVAAFELLDYLAEGGAAIYYSGDLDAEGMEIADRLWQRYGDSLHLWRMNCEDYYASVSEESLSPRQSAKLAHLKNDILQRSADCVRKEKKAGYQENLLPQLLQDILDGGRMHD